MTVRPPALARDVASLALLFALGLLFFWPFLTPDPRDRRSIIEGDFTNQFYPFHAYTASELHRGRLPLWNPYIFGGHPFQADPQTAVFAPQTLISAWLLGNEEGLTYQAMTLRALSNYAIAAFLVYLLVRRLTGHRGAALVGATVYTFSGYLTSYPLQQLPILETAALAPLPFYLIERGRESSRRAAWSAAAGLAFGLAILAGHPQAALFLGYALVLYLIVRSWGEGALRLATKLVLFLAFAVGLSAVQLLPTWDFAGRSTRAAIDYAKASYGFELQALPGILLPWWRGETPLYIGIAPLLLAAVALARGRPPAFYWGGLALFGALLSVGGNTFLYRTLFLLAPGFATFQHQERAIGLTALAGAVLSGYGIAALAEAAPGLRERVAAWGRILPGAWGVLAIGLILSVFGWQSELGTDHTYLQGILGTYVFFLLMLAPSLGLLAFWRYRGWHPALLFGLLAVIVLDLFTISSGNNSAPGPYESPTLQRTRALLAAMPEPGRIRLTADTVLPGNYGALVRIETIDGDSPIQDARLQTLLAVPDEWRLWELLNVRYVLSRNPLSVPGLTQLFDEDGLLLYQIQGALPRAYAARAVEVYANPKLALDNAMNSDVHPGDRAVLEESPPIPLPARVAERPRVDVVRWEPAAVELTTSGREAALVVISAPFDPGWRARVDGKPVRLLRTNYALMGLAVEAGEHRIAIRYDPPPFRVGATISIGTILAFAGLLVASRLPPRRPRPR